MTLTHLLKQLADDSLLDPNAIPDVLKTAEESTPPKHRWYMHLLIAIIAWNAAPFFLGLIFLVASNFGWEVVTQITLAILGAILCVVVILKQGNMTLIKEMLWLTILLVGEVLLLFSLASLIDDYNNRNTIIFVAMITLMLMSAMFFLFNSRVHRFGSFLLAVLSVVVILYEIEWLDGIHLLIALTAVGTLWLWQNRPRLLASPNADLFDPLCFAAPTALLALITPSFFNDANVVDIHWWWATALIMGAILIVLIIDIFRDYGFELMSRPVILTLIGVGIMLIPAWQMPGILAGLMLFLLSFWRNNRILMALATLYFLFSISFYYYSLDLTLLTKSLVLMATGALFLVGAFIARRLTA